MKTRLHLLLAVIAAVALNSCALPEDQRIIKPPAPAPQVAPTPVYTIPEPAPKQVVQPNYLDIADQEDNEIVQEDLDTVFQSMAYINDRLFEYGRKLDRWKELDSQSVSMDISEEEAAEMVRCFRRLQNVLNGYGRLRSKALQAQKVTSSVGVDNEEFFKLQQDDIAFLEDSCGRLLADTEEERLGWQQREEKADLAQLETLIDRYAANREFEEVIQVWLQIPEFQLNRVHLRTKILYANALMYLHQEEKAAEIYQEVVDQLYDSDEQPTDIVSLRKVLADLYTASGKYREAAVQYNRISGDYANLGRLEEWSKLQLSILDRAQEGSPELTEYAAMLRNYLGFIPEQDGYKVVWQAEQFLAEYPYSPVTSNVGFIRERVTEQADKWFNGFLADVDRLAREKKFTEALELLETMPTDIIGADKQIVLKDKNEELLLAEAVDKETERMALMQELQSQWNNGMMLAKDGRYDESIAVFTNLLDTEFANKAEEQIDKVALEAAKSTRKKAANLFIRFTKTTDLDSRIKLLIESRKLLKSILVKYPGVEIASKVIGNIERVEQEMNAIDPTLVLRADQESQEEPEIDGVDTVFATPGPVMPEQQEVIENNLPPQTAGQ